jgi:L-methionine (R)-S-oxide reductase
MSNRLDTKNSSAFFEEKIPELRAHFTGNWLTDLANFSAFVQAALPRLNWVGFYLYDGRKLRLGPFQGKPACTEIQPGRGVCGSAFQRKEPVLVPDVHAFPDHITCDTDSRSELVLPMILDGQVIGVLDIDSPDLDRFSGTDRDGLQVWLKALLNAVPMSVWLSAPWK